MKSTIFACVLVAFLVQSAYGERTLLQSSSEGAYGADSSGPSSVEAHGTAKSNGGAVTVKAYASAKAIQEAQSSIARIFVDAANKVYNGESASAVVSGAAKAIGYAVAKAYASAYASVNSYGNAEGCAYAYGSASAEAEAYAEAIVKGAAEAASQSKHAIATLDVKAVASVSVEAFAEARAHVCASGDAHITAYQNSFGEALGYVYAKAIGHAFANITPYGGEAGAYGTADSGTIKSNKSGTEGGVEATTYSPGSSASGYADGKGYASAQEHKSCDDIGYGRCCRSYGRFGLRSTCYCGFRCRAYLRNNVYEIEGSSEKCVC